MSTYEPGTVARIEMTLGKTTDVYERCIWDACNEGWVSGTHGRLYPLSGGWQVTDVRPLVVLDLEAIGDHLHPKEKARGGVVTMLRDTESLTARMIADQIEAQTKPPRIPEPGLWGVVEAHSESTIDKPESVRQHWTRDETGWVAIGSGFRVREWSHLANPVLVREGVES